MLLFPDGKRAQSESGFLPESESRLLRGSLNGMTIFLVYKTVNLSVMVPLRLFQTASSSSMALRRCTGSISLRLIRMLSISTQTEKAMAK